MRKFVRSVGGASMIVLGSARLAAAQGVDDYNAFKVMSFQQTSASPASAPSVYYCNLGFDALSSDAFTTGTVTWATTTGDSPGTLTALPTYFLGATEIWPYWWPGVQVATKAGLDAECPTTTYTFAVSGGSLGATSAILTLAPDAYSAATPAIDPASYQALQAYRPLETVIVSTVAHPQGTGTQFTATYLSVIDAVSNATVAAGSNVGADAGIVTLQIDGGVLSPAHAYQVSVDFSDRVVTTDAGFGTATAFTAFEQRSSVDFETLLDDGGVPPSDAGPMTDAGAIQDASQPADASTTPDASIAPEDAGAPSGSSSGGSSGSSSGGGGGDASVGLVPSGGSSGGSSGGGGICSATAVGAERGAGGGGILALAAIALAGPALRWGRRRRRG
jgi:hypothetical protein